MRVLTRMSAAFLLLDSRERLPVTGASILVDGQRLPYVAKKDGHYIFLDLPETDHVYELSAPGYGTVRKRVPAGPAGLETLVLQCDPDNPRLKRIPHIRLRVTRQGRPASGERVQVLLRTVIGTMRVIETAREGGMGLALAGNGGNALRGQRCRTDSGMQVTLAGWDYMAKCAWLQEPLPDDLPAGTLLRPFWELELNRDGTAVLAVQNLFLQGNEWELALTLDGEEQALTVPVPRGPRRLNVDFKREVR